MEEEMIGGLVAQTIGMGGPGPEPWGLYRLLGQGGDQPLGQPRGRQAQPAQTYLGTAGLRDKSWLLLGTVNNSKRGLLLCAFLQRYRFLNLFSRGHRTHIFDSPYGNNTTPIVKAVLSADIYSGLAPIELQSVTGRCLAHMQLLDMSGFCAHCRRVAAS